ncbi:hypothetical protein OHV05_18850 [Kitasatospora sp. NBC_00070]|uniref:hypothetical protein n=1 Tax=Kitasatospora sp. NBC_00070 TaxID=2975962 RepID=UPI00324CA388
MSARSRRHTAISLAIAVTTGTTLLLTSCSASTTANSAAAATGSPAAPSVAPSAAPTAAPTAPPTASPSADPTGAPTATPSAPSAPPVALAAVADAPRAVLNGTARNGLTISNGTRYVVMNGTTVDFGTEVRDLVWSPNGRKAAFVNGAGDLVVTDPDGSSRVTVARHPAGETWSHPAWQVSAASPYGYYTAKNNLFFTAAKGGVTRLKSVPATTVGGTPQLLGLGTYSGPDSAQNPTTGNVWAAGGGADGRTVYANSDSGEVFIRDEALRQQGGPVAKGSEPTLSPDGHDIVFVRAVNGHDHLFRTDSHEMTGPAKDLTPHATTDYTEPAWSPDGRTVAARTPAGIVTLPANGSAAPTLVSGHHGLPAYRQLG